MSKKSAEISAEKKSAEKVKKKYKKRKGKSSGEKQDKYHRLISHKLKLVYAMKRRGLSDEEIAVNFGVAYSTFRVYVKKYPELSAALGAGAREAVLYVENALFEKSVGIRETVKKPIKVKRVRYDDHGRKLEEECVEYADEEVFIPPETNAAKFYLLNRAPELWREHREPAAESNGGGIVFIPKRNDES